MNTIISSFAKLAACTAVLIGAPLITFSAVDFTLAQIQEEMDYQTCVDVEKLNRIGTKCVR